MTNEKAVGHFPNASLSTRTSSAFTAYYQFSLAASICTELSTKSVKTSTSIKVEAN